MTDPPSMPLRRKAVPDEIHFISVTADYRPGRDARHNGATNFYHLNSNGCQAKTAAT